MGAATVLDVGKQYTTAIAVKGEKHLHALRANTYTQNVLYRDGAHAIPRTALKGEDLYHALFATYPDGHVQVTDTLIGEWILQGLVLHQWSFRRTESEACESLARADRSRQYPTGRVIRLYGTSIYHISAELMQSETISLIALHHQANASLRFERDTRLFLGANRYRTPGWSHTLKGDKRWLT